MAKNHIVVEYDTVVEIDSNWGQKMVKPVLKRIINWKKSPEGKLVWKETKCPQKSFVSIKGYYDTMKTPVTFYNREKQQMENYPPKMMNL